MQYPPFIIITKEADGTANYRGVSIDILNHIGNALEIRLVLFPSINVIWKFEKIWKLYEFV